jgi:hypothetical protein
MTSDTSTEACKAALLLVPSPSPEKRRGSAAQSRPSSAACRSARAAMADVSLSNLSEHARGLHGVPAQCVPARKCLAPGPLPGLPAARAGARLDTCAANHARGSASHVPERAGAAAERAAVPRCLAACTAHARRSPCAAATSSACTACSSRGRSSPPRWGPRGARPRPVQRAPATAVQRSVALVHTMHSPLQRRAGTRRAAGCAVPGGAVALRARGSRYAACAAEEKRGDQSQSGRLRRADLRSASRGAPWLPGCGPTCSSSCCWSSASPRRAHSPREAHRQCGNTSARARAACLRLPLLSAGPCGPSRRVASPRRHARTRAVGCCAAF